MDLDLNNIFNFTIENMTLLKILENNENIINNEAELVK